jgi:hypothetical protein
MKNLISGTKNFAQQIARKMQTSKNFTCLVKEDEFCNKKLYEFTTGIFKKKTSKYSSNRMYNSYRDSLTEKEFLLIMEIDENSSNLFEVSNRCYVNNQLYHSLSYTRKGSIDSYTVCFINNKNEHFGKVIKYVLVNKNIYAIIEKYHINKNFDDFPPISKILGNTINTKRIKDFFLKYYYCFDENRPILKLVPISCIVCKCLIVYSKTCSFFTKIAYNFEHD